MYMEYVNECLHGHSAQSRTDEEDGEGDEEQEDMGHKVQGVDEAAIVEHTSIHAVRVIHLVNPTEWQGHATCLIGPHKP